MNLQIYAGLHQSPGSTTTSPCHLQRVPSLRFSRHWAITPRHTAPYWRGNSFLPQRGQQYHHCPSISFIMRSRSFFRRCAPNVRHGFFASNFIGLLYAVYLLNRLFVQLCLCLFEYRYFPVISIIFVCVCLRLFLYVLICKGFRPFPLLVCACSCWCVRFWCAPNVRQKKKGRGLLPGFNLSAPIKFHQQLYSLQALPRRGLGIVPDLAECGKLGLPLLLIHSLLSPFHTSI